MKNPEEIFAERAAFYTHSACHKDPEVLAQLVAWAEPQGEEAVLDIATGTGHTAFAFAPHVRSVIGVDVTPEMLREAEGLKAEYQLENVSFQVADAHQLPFSDHTFQIVTCRRAAHHFQDMALALQEMKRVLKPGGKLLIDDRSVPEDESVDAIMNHLDILHDPSHVKEYRLSEWESMLNQAGFRVEQRDMYIKHRPLSALMGGVDAAGISEIQAIVAGLTEPQRQLMNVAEKEGEIHLNHWYVMVLAVQI